MLRHPARLAGSSLLRLQSDERLASLAVDGHEAAFAAIVDRYRTPLQRYCSGIVGPARAEDTVQQTLISAHEALKRTTEVRHLRSWLYRIAHNAALNVLRAVRDDVPLDPGHAAVGDGPDAAVERAERLRETLAAVQALPERQRAALVLRELEGRSHEEIATALGVTTGSARQSLMRARAAVRGAVTAITPYPLLVKLASGLVSAPAGAGWTETAAGVGAGATLAKLTAGVVATGALVGSAVGTQHVVHHGHRAAVPAADGSRPQRQTTAHATLRAASAPAATAVAVPVSATVAHGTSATGTRSTAFKKASTHRRANPASQPRHHAAGGGSTGSSSGGRDDGRQAGSNDERAHDDVKSGEGGRRFGKQRSGSGGDDNAPDERATGPTTSGRSGKDESGGDSSGSGSGGQDGTPTPVLTTPVAPPAAGGGEGGDDGGRSGSSGHGGSAPSPVTVPTPGDD